MKFNFLRILLLLCTFLNAQEERIDLFHAEIEIDSNALITVTENIHIVAYGNAFKHGIVRSLPRYKTDSAGHQQVFNYEILKVSKDGRTSPYHVKKEKNNLVIYVGKKNFLLPHGSHEYTITYTAENAISFRDDFDEFYWNVNGFGWDFSMAEVSANVKLPQGAEIFQSACYTGVYGSNASDCIATSTKNTIQFKAKNIRANNNLTIAVGVSKGFIHEPPPPPPPTFLEKFGLTILAFLLIVGLSIYYLLTWKKYGVDPPKPIAYPLFEIPEQLSPASVGMIKKEHYWDDLITAAIINLGIKGYLKIEELEIKELFGLYKTKIYKLIKTKDGDKMLPKEETRLLKGLFPNKAKNTVLLDGKYNSDIEKAVSRFKISLNDQYKPIINEGNNYKYLIIPMVIIVPFLVLAFIFSLKRGASNLNFYSFLIFLFFSIVSIILYQYLIRRPTEKKLAIQSKIKGFEMYLKMTEERQIQHFNPPDTTPEIFEKYLPYAIALGAEKVWGERFLTYLSKSSINQDYQSSWYVGANLNTINFAHHLNTNLSNSVNSSATPPSSSNIGSGGGGFSGGGGGGGGGGGW